MNRIFRWIWKSKDESNLDQLNMEDKILQQMSWPLNETYDALSKSFFNNIPNEIILYIFRYLSVHDLCNISLVCRSFKLTADHDEIWKTKCKTSVKLHSKSYRQMYIEWIDEKMLRYKKTVAYQNYCKRTRPCYIGQPYPFPIRRINNHKLVSISGFSQHPDSIKDLTIQLLVDIDQTARPLITLLEQTSKFREQWFQSTILKQMIQRYYRFMQLKASNPSNIQLIPTLDIEIVWQTHLLRPEMYRNDCFRLFRRIIDHSLIVKDQMEQFFKNQAFLDTCQLYEQTFGENYCALPLYINEKKVILHEDYKSVYVEKSIYCYWDETHFNFSLEPSSNYENPFSFTEDDIILDGKRFDLWKETMSQAIKVASLKSTFHQSIPFYIYPPALKRFQKSYERFLYMASKYPNLKDADDFLPSIYAIDIIWHLHMQEPLNYEKDCLRLVGYIVSHNLRTIIEEQNLKKSCDELNQIWKEVFQDMFGHSEAF